ncbi:MAG: radical SAM protein [bacterium]
MKFDPIDLSKRTEELVIKGNQRRYNGFRLEHFYGQIATARGVGCNLRCCFCWINPSRDCPEKCGRFYSPEEVYEKAMETASSKYGKWIMTHYLRISGCEPTLGKEHLLGIIELCAKSGKPEFLLETNGILLGWDNDYVKELSKFKKILFIRLSLKAGTSAAFEEKTGAKSEFFELPFEAIKLLKEHRMRFKLAAMSDDYDFLPPLERQNLLVRLINIGAAQVDLDEEKPDLFGITKKRLGNRIIGNFVYSESLFDSLLRALVIREGFIGLEDEKLLGEGIPIFEKRLEKYNRRQLAGLIKYIKFEKQGSPCVSCKRNNPWHGHGVEDDLDEEKLGKFIH